MNTQVGRETNRLLFIVARDQLDLWQHLKRDFAQDAEVEVILDRRRGERRQRAQVRAHDRRRVDRRRKSGIDKDLRYRSFVIIHEPSDLSPALSVEPRVPPVPPRPRLSDLRLDVRWPARITPGGYDAAPGRKVPPHRVGGEGSDDRMIQESMTKDERERALVALMNEGYRMPPNRADLLAKVVEMRKREGRERSNISAKDERERALLALINEGYKMPPSRAELLAKVMEMRKRGNGEWSKTSKQKLKRHVEPSRRPASALAPSVGRPTATRLD